MEDSQLKRREERAEYINNWYKLEKSVERIGAVILFFASALIVVFDKPGDQWTLVILVAGIAGAITLFTKSRSPRSARTALHFLKAPAQTTRATFAAMGGMLLITQMGIRPLAIIVGVVLGIVAIYYQWRAYKIRQLDAKFKPTEQDIKGESL